MPDGASIDQLVPKVERMIGSPEVDYTEIASVLSQAGRAMDMVRGSSFGQNLTNIAYVYNTVHGGAFGVFDPNIDRSLKIKVVEKELKDRGYGVQVKGGKHYAWFPGKDSDEISAEMDKLYGQLDVKGGIAIGINAQRIMQVAKQNFAAMQQASGTENEPVSNDDLDALVALHLGATIVHESVHAMGDQGEQGPIQAQEKWTNEVLSAINGSRAAEKKPPLRMSGEIYHAKSFRDMVKLSQQFFQQWVLPEAFLRMNFEDEQSHFPVKKGKHDSLETILEKNWHKPVPAGFVIERALEKDRHLQADKPLEDLFDENRPHALIAPVTKTAGINSNIGGPFISSPFAIDENVPRLMSGTDITDRISYKEGEDPYWQMRYKPENVKFKRTPDGRMGFQYDERLRIHDYNQNFPATWHELFREDNFVGPWRKMAADGDGVDEAKNEVLALLRVVGYYKGLVKDGKRNGSRFVCDHDISSYVLEALSDMETVVFDHGNEMAIWVVSPDVNREKIARLETIITEGGDMDEVDEFVGTAKDIRDRMNAIFDRARVICREHGISGVYVVGGFPRMLSDSRDFREVNDLDFTSGWPDECLKLGGLLAAELGASDLATYSRTMTISFTHMGIRMDFRGPFVPVDVRPMLREAGIPTTPLNFDVYARDFTVNSLMYDFMENKIYDVSGRGLADLKAGLLRTHFDPELIVPRNPLIITRAVVLNLKGFEIDPALHAAMKGNIGFLGEKVSAVRLAYEYDKIVKYEGGMDALEGFGLEWLKDVREQAERENPKLFKEGD